MGTGNFNGSASDPVTRDDAHGDRHRHVAGRRLLQLEAIEGLLDRLVDRGAARRPFQADPGNAAGGIRPDLDPVSEFPPGRLSDCG